MGRWTAALAYNLLTDTSTTMNDCETEPFDAVAQFVRVLREATKPATDLKGVPKKLRERYEAEGEYRGLAWSCFCIDDDWLAQWTEKFFSRKLRGLSRALDGGIPKIEKGEHVYVGGVPVEARVYHALCPDCERYSNDFWNQFTPRPWGWTEFRKSKSRLHPFVLGFVRGVLTDFCPSE